MELFEPILHFFAQRWVHNIIWAGILAIGTAVAAKVASKTLRHLLNRDDNPLPFHPASSSTSRTPSYGRSAAALSSTTALALTQTPSSPLLASAASPSRSALGHAVKPYRWHAGDLYGHHQTRRQYRGRRRDGRGPDITWRHTTIEDACGQTIIVPNSNISKNTLVHLMPFGRVAVPVAVKDTSKWASLDALADELTSATKTAVSPISGFDKEPYVLFSEIGDFGIKGKIIFIVSDDSTTFTAADACIRAIAPIIA